MKKDDLTIENEDLAVQNAWAANAQWAWPRNYAMVRVDSVPSMVWLKWTTNANHGDESQLSGFVAKLVVVFIQYMSFVTEINIRNLLLRGCICTHIHLFLMRIIIICNL